MTRMDERIDVAGALGREELERARERGIRLVIDLREDGEPVPHGLDPWAEQVLATALGLVHRRVPIGPSGWFRAAFAEIDAHVQAASGRVLLHCASGRRAAAAAVAVEGRARGWTVAACTELLRARGFDPAAMPPLGRAVAEYVAYGPARDPVPGEGLGI